MDGMALIQEALKVAATAAAGTEGSETDKALVAQIRRLFHGRREAELVLEEFQRQPRDGSVAARAAEMALLEELRRSQADQDPSVLDAAQQVLALMVPQQQATGKFITQAAGDIGTVIQIDQVQMTAPSVGAAQRTGSGGIRSPFAQAAVPAFHRTPRARVDRSAGASVE